jgi:hypothetical protein
MMMKEGIQEEDSDQTAKFSRTSAMTEVYNILKGSYHPQKSTQAAKLATETGKFIRPEGFELKKKRKKKSHEFTSPKNRKRNKSGTGMTMVFVAAAILIVLLLAGLALVRLPGTPHKNSLETETEPQNKIMNRDELISALKEVNPRYSGKGKIFAIGVNITSVSVPDTFIFDISPLKGLPLQMLNIEKTDVSDLSPLKGMPLYFLNIHATKVSSLKDLEGMELETLLFSPSRIKDFNDFKIIRNMKSIKYLGTSKKIPAEEFWKKFDKYYSKSK